MAKVFEATWEAVRTIEPALGKVSSAQVIATRTALERVVVERAALRDRGEIDTDEATQLDGAMATVYARAAAIAIAAGDEANTERWLREAELLSKDDDQRAELAAARQSHERYRALVHGRNLIANDRESAARAIWKQLTKAAPDAPDAIARAAADELKAPRPLGPNDSTPSLGRFNGFGVGFYGRRDPWPNRSYVTTHCISALWIPVLPLSAWRVIDAEGGYHVLAREQLSPFARLVRWAVPAAVVLAIVGFGITSYMNDPERLARQRWDAALDVAQHGDAETALHQLDGELERDLPHVDAARAAQAGAQIVRLTAGYVARPFTKAQLDQAIRVVHRYQALPQLAQAGAAQRDLLALLDGWIHQLGDGLDTAEVRLALLGAAAEIADAGRRPQLATQIATTRLALAAAREADAPLDALAILVEHTDLAAQTGEPERRATAEAADKIIARLAEAPALLLDAGADFDAWLAITKADQLRLPATKLRELAQAGRNAAEADGVTPKQLAELAAKAPSDQYVALQLARNDAGAGALDAAAARLTRLGPPGMLIRGARVVLAQIDAAQGKLEAADALFGALLGTRVQRFAAASAALRDTAKRTQDRVEARLRTGDVPDDLKRSYEAAAGETERHDLISRWIDDQMKNDAPLTAARERYIALGDVVPVSLAAGSVKLRRAQAMAARAQRDARGRRAHVPGDPHRGRGPARISDGARRDLRAARQDHRIRRRVRRGARQERFAAQPARRDRVPRHRSVARAKQIATQVFASATSPVKEAAAHLLGVMSNEDEDEAEGWYRKADQPNSFVRAALLEVEGKRLRREGKTVECAAKFAEAAKLHLATANTTDTAAYNNAAVANEMQFACSGEPQALRDAAAAPRARVSQRARRSDRRRQPGFAARHRR